MAVKYRVEYKDINSIDTRIDMADSDYASSVIDLLPAAEPLVYDLPDATEDFKAVQGSGGTIRVLGKDSDDLRSLYTADPKKYTVTVYKDGTTSSHVVFLGYISIGSYTEPFSEYDNYEVAISFHDGLNLLKRYEYRNGTSEWTGYGTIWQTLFRVLDQLYLPFNDIRVVSDMYFSGYTISNDSILEQLEVNSANYYDEQGDAISFREALEAVLKPLGLICFTQGGSLWLLDPLMLQRSSYTIMKFNASTGAYLSSEVVSPNKGINVTVFWWETGAMLDYQNGHSKIKLSYSGYAPDDLTGWSDWQDKALHSAEGTWSLQGGGSGDDYDKNTTWGGIDNWTLSNGAEWRGTRLSDGDTEEFHIRWPRADPDGGGDGLARAVFSGGEYLHYVSGQYLKIVLWCNPVTATGYYNGGNVFGDDRLYGLYQGIRLKVGSHYWNETTKSWSTTPQDTFMPLKSKDRIDNRWTEFMLGFKLSAGVTGQVEFTLYDDSLGFDDELSINLNGDLRNHHFRDIAFMISDAGTNTLEYDREYECDLNTDWQDEAPKIELIHGDSTDGVATHKGGFVYDDGFVTDFRYGDMTTYESLPEVLFKKYASQYQESRMLLSGKLECTDIHTSGLAKTGNISDSVNLAGKLFVLRSGRFHDRDQYIDGTWIEQLADDIEIT